MSDTSDLTVRVLDDRDIVVVADTGFEVTYRKDGQLPMLVATDQLRGRVNSSKAKFLAQAWKAAYQKAKTLGWLAR
jgi:metallophosphoesterase superfamily enzyme